MKARYWLPFVVLSIAPALARADVKPSAICSEGMVLQQKTDANLWGKADPGEEVTVSFRGKKASAKADAKGNWLIAIPAGDAGGPFALTIAGKNTIAYKNVLVGEVWVCSGQSNMEARVGQYLPSGDLASAAKAPHNAMLRVFNVKKSPQASPQSETGGSWIEADPKTVAGFTAVGYFFGRNLQENLKVPVGLIHTSWGGTRIEAWMSASALAPYEKPNPKAKLNQNSASALYNGMIHPILNYGVKGAIWYQGESNAGNAFKYRSTHPAMIENWRADFKNPDLAFYFVQLAPYDPSGSWRKGPSESNWAELREAQTMTLKLKNTGMAVITDVGSEYDIHPTPKRPVGERLALAARAQTYGEKIVYSGPMYTAVKLDGKKAIISFDHVGGGLIAKEMVATLERKGKNGTTVAAWRAKDGSNDTPLTGFTICGKDKKFVPAQAQIVGATVVVSSPMVAEPIAVRFGWANHPLCNLFNREGLPASPFRTDALPGITQPKKSTKGGGS